MFIINSDYIKEKTMRCIPIIKFQPSVAPTISTIFIIKIPCQRYNSRKNFFSFIFMRMKGLQIWSHEYDHICI